MRRLLRASLITVTTITIATVRRATGVWERFREQQFVDDEVKPTGWLATAYARSTPWMEGWLYALFARALNLEPDDEVLDVACGSGTFLRLHAAHVQLIAGLDHSEDLIDIALRENRERVEAGTAEFVVGDATDLPWPDNRFSVVTCNCIDCFGKKARPALEEMHRVLQPGGRVVVADNRQEMMEDIGFTDVSAQRVLWGYVTTGYNG
jgi:SAM-dependent methyltransferase